MAENIFQQLALSAFDFLKGVLFFSIPVFFFVLIALIARRLISKRFNLSWLKSTAIVTFVMLLCLVCAVYAFPLIEAFSVPDYENIPPEFQEPLADQVLFFFSEILRLVLASAIISLLLFPLILAGSFVFDWISGKTKLPFVIRLFGAVFVSTAIASYFLFFVFPFALPGILFMIFFGLG